MHCRPASVVLNLFSMKKWIFAALGLLLLIGVIVYVQIRQSKLDARPFSKDITFSSAVQIYNYTDYSRLDTMLYVVVAEVQGIDSVKIFCYNITDKLNDKMSRGIGELQAFVLPAKGCPSIYKLYLKPGLDMGTLKLTISHESVHIMQYYSNRLIDMGSTIKFEDELFTYREANEMKYRTRPWEKEAFNKQALVKKQLENILYK